MIETVFVFGFVNIIFELVLISMVPVKPRLRLLGSEMRSILHLIMLLINITVHWGTVIGTMSSIVAFCASILTVNIARKAFGFIESGRYYTVGWIKYSVKELT